MREEFVPKKFRPATLARIANANAIIGDYQTQGLKLTLRQLYYQMVARGIIPNTVREYDKLGSTVSNARLAGLIDWNAIEDRTSHASYVDRYGEDCWELDALEPLAMRNLIEREIVALRDDEIWNTAIDDEESERDQLTAVAEKWDWVIDHLGV